MIVWEQPLSAVWSSEARLGFLTTSGEPGQYLETNVALYDSTTRDALEAKAWLWVVPPESRGSRAPLHETHAQYSPRGSS